MTTHRGLRVTLLVAGTAVVLGGCELIASVDRSKISDEGPDVVGGTGASESGGSGGQDPGSGGLGGEPATGGETSGGSSPGGAAGMGGAAGSGPSTGGEPSTGGTSSGGTGGTGGGSDNTCPSEGMGGASGTPDVPEIVGSYLSGTDESNTFETPELIGNESWTQGSDEWVYYYAAVDNEQNLLIAQNGEDNFFFGCLWSRFVWFETDGKLYFCQDVFDAASQAEAEAAESGTNESDLNAGCLGAGWYQLKAQ